MLKIHKNYIFDEDKNLVAVQIPIDEFVKLEETIENYGLSRMIDEVKLEKSLSVNEAKEYYKSLKNGMES
jgi:hypothetical protein